jgi:hypothetical protein
MLTAQAGAVRRMPEAAERLGNSAGGSAAGTAPAAGFAASAGDAAAGWPVPE